MPQYAIKHVNTYMYIIATNNVNACNASPRMAHLVSKVSLTREVFAIIETIHLATLKCKQKLQFRGGIKACHPQLHNI